MDLARAASWANIGSFFVGLGALYLMFRPRGFTMARTTITMWIFLLGLILAGYLHFAAARIANETRYPRLDQLVKLSNKEYINETIDIDGKSFEYCKFTNVTLFYHGNGDGRFKSCTFAAGGSIILKTDNKAILNYEKLRAVFSDKWGSQAPFGVDADGKRIPLN